MDRDETVDVPARQVAVGFAGLLNALDHDFDVDRLAVYVTRCCTTIFGVAGAGLSLADEDGWLRVAAVSSESFRAMEAAAVDYQQGPGPDSFIANLPVPSTELAGGRWPKLSPFARAHDLGAACAVPVRDGQRAVGALSLYQGHDDGRVPDLAIAKAVAQAAGTWLQSGQELRRSATVSEHPQCALTSRVVIEQAKGMLAERWQLTPDETFPALRQHARSHHLSLRQVADEVVSGSLELARPAA